MSIRGNGGHTRCPALQCKAFPCTTLFFFFTPNSPHFALFSPQIHSYFAPVSPKFRPCSPLFHPNSSNRLFCFFMLRLSVLFNQFLALFFKGLFDNIIWVDLFSYILFYLVLFPFTVLLLLYLVWLVVLGMFSSSIV